MLASLHVILGVAFLFNLISNKEESPRYVSFLVFFCSGIITGGLALGTKTHMALKIYFGIFCLSVFVFIISPSSLLKFLVTADFSRGHTLLPVYKSYFLEKQGSAFSSDTARVKYKIIEKKGMLHKTVSRDLDFNGTLDSVRIISLEENKNATVRGYTSLKSYVEDKIDSTDVSIDFHATRENQIERRL